MRIFEFQFNPKARKDRFFRVFSYEPKDETEEERGSLYIVGELQHVLPANTNFLQKLADLISKEYAEGAKSDQGKKKTFSATQSLKKSLRKANDFLAAESKKGNVDWLGNLHLALLLFVPANGEYTLYFTKVGDMKVWMARNGSLVDVGMSLEKEEEAGSAKVFGNVGSGKVAQEDRIAVVTKELFEAFSKENILQTMSQLSEEKQLKNLFKNREKALTKAAGVLFFFYMEPFVRQEESQPIETPSLPLKVPRMPNFSRASFPSFKRPNISVSGMKPPSVPMPKVSVPEKFSPKQKLRIFQNAPLMKKALGLLFVLALILGIGFGIFKGGSFSNDSAEAQAALESAQSLQFQAEQALLAQHEDEANRLYQEAWQEIRSYRDRDEFQVIQQEIETQLQKLNNIDFLGNPELFLQLDTSQVPETPQEMLVIGGTLYFFHPFSSQLIAVEASTKAQAFLSPGRNLRFGDTFGNSFLFFADPNILVEFSESAGWQERQISLPEGFQPQGLASFGNNVYLFSGSTGEIAKIPVNQTTTEPWVDVSSTKKPLDAISIAIDGNIWVLKPGGEIQRYFKGRYEESLTINTFPPLKNPTKIYTRAQLPYLYVLDAEHARVLVITKFGDVIRQYQSSSFEQATDFAVSSGGDTVYLLAGEDVYRLQGVLEES